MTARPNLRPSPRLAVHLTVLLAALAMTATAQAPTDERVALVIGNAAYPAPATLANPVNDAVAMSATLKTLGFAVVEARDATREQMNAALAQVRQRLAGKKGIGVLYYAGHGLQVDFRNFMVPVDARLGSAADIPAQTLDVGQVIDAFKAAGNRMNILVLDACRDNPFADKAGGKGLAPLDAPPGTFLAYATAPGNVAADGDLGSGNGLYTGYLVKELQKPAARIEDVFKRVRLQVRQHSKGRQIPWESTSLEDDFYFNDGVRYTFRQEDLARVTAAARQREEELQRQAQEAERAAERDKQLAAAKALEELRAAEARRQQELALAAELAREQERLSRLSREKAAEEAFNAQKAEWDRIKDSRNVDDFYAFLAKYTSGGIAELALARVERLQQAQITAQPDRDGKVQAPLGRYREGDRYEFITRDGMTNAELQRGVIVTRVVGEDEVEGVAVSGNVPGARATRNGFVLADGAGTYDPPWVAVPGGDLQVGKRIAGRSIRTMRNGQKIWVDYDTRVVGREKIQTSFGVIDTYRVDITFLLQNGARGRFTFWYDPDWGYSVRLRQEFRNSASAPPDIRVREMVARSRKE